MMQNHQEPTATEERVLQAFMRRLHTIALRDAPRMPDAKVVWLKACLIRKWEAERRVQRPIDLMEPFEIAASIAAAMLLLTWSVPSAFSWLPRLTF